MKSELEKRLKEKTELLIYYLPLTNGYLSLEEASEFYIEQKKNALSLMRAYTISKLNYHEFLTQVLRKRCMTFRIRKKTEESEAARLHYEEGRILIEETIAKEHYPLYEFSNRTKLDTSGMNIRDLAKFMVENRQEIKGEVLDPAESYLQNRLRKESIRKYFITLLLYIPHVENDYFCLKLACIFELERSVFDRLFELKEIQKNQDKEKRNRQKEIANRHFRVLLRLESAYNITGNESEKKRILEAIEKVRAITDDFIESTGRKEGLIAWVFKLIEEGDCVIYSVNINAATREHTVSKQRLKDVLDSFLPQQVKGGIEVEGFYIKADGDKVWAFEPIEHFLVCLIPDERGTALNVRVYQADPALADIIEYDQNAVLEHFMNDVMPKVAERFPQLSPMNHAKQADPERLFEDLMSLLQNPDEHMPKREVTLELTGQPAVTMNLSHLFGFRAVKEGEKKTEHLTVYFDGHHYWLYSVTPGAADADAPLMTLEQITPEQIVDLARRMVWGQTKADEVLQTQKWIN